MKLLEGTIAMIMGASSGIGVGTGGVRAWAGFDLLLGLWLIYTVV